MSHATKENLNLFWFLPTHGDGRYLGTTEGGRAVDLPYLQQIRWRQIIWATTV